MVQESSRADQNITGIVDHLIAVAYLDMPFPLFLVKLGSFYAMSAFDVPSEIVLCYCPLKVLLNFFA